MKTDLIDTQLEINGLSKSFNGQNALNDICLDIPRGEVLGLLGPSGCGKTTLLRCIAGLTPPDSGSIRVGGAEVSGKHVNLPPEKRQLGMVFQDYALWPHMSIWKNVAFPLEMRRVNADERERQVNWALDLVGLSAFSQRSPGTLSGGQQQRVALARAIVGQPRLLLMDEPLSNLDKSLREQLALDIRGLITELELTAVFVTHDQQEAYALADRIAVFQQGEVCQTDSPQQLFENPATPSIAEFLDVGSIIKASAHGPSVVTDDGSTVLPLEVTGSGHGPLTVLVPRRALTLHPQQVEGSIPVTPVQSVFQGERYLVRVQLPGTETTLALTSSSQHRPGEPAHLKFDASLIRGWDHHQQPVLFQQLSKELADAL